MCDNSDHAASEPETPEASRNVGGDAGGVGERRTGSFSSRRAAVKYWVLLAAMVLLGLGFAAGLIVYDNPVPMTSPVFWVVARRRTVAVVTMLIVACCQAIATVSFQTVTNNRIITPSIMGFESLYTLINTSFVFFLGASGVARTETFGVFLVQVGLMVALSLALYSWLLFGDNNLHAMLLVGIVIGGGLGSLSTFMQRLLSPSEFDVLTARLFGSINNADPAFFPVAIPLVVCAVGALFVLGGRLNILALGREMSVTLGLNHRVLSVIVLMLVSVLMAVSTSLVGPMTFLGFLVATLAYQFVDTYDHRFLFPMAMAAGFVILTGAYFLMNHVFYAQGVVSIIIELVGGSLFLIVILRKGRL